MQPLAARELNDAKILTRHPLFREWRAWSTLEGIPALARRQHHDHLTAFEPRF
jgi:hypothetical protein